MTPPAVYRATALVLASTIALLVVFQYATTKFGASTPTPTKLHALTSSVRQPVGQAGWSTMIFSDEFDTPSLNTVVWTPGWFGTGITGPINAACHDSNLISQPGDGSLHLKFIPQQNTCRTTASPYTGGLVSSNPSDGVAGHIGFQFTYGYKEFRAYLPPTATRKVGNWPALWSAGQRWPADGEDDVVEGLHGGQACYHFHSSAGDPGGCAHGNYGGWHTFGSDWQPGSVTYYYDGVRVGKITRGVTAVPHYLIMNTGHHSDVVVAPSELLVDYVRVWQ